MPIYQCLLRAENLSVEEDGAAVAFGFYTSRWVDAANEREASAKVVQSLKEDPAFDWRGSPDAGQARICVEDVEEVDELPGSCRIGAAWYRM